MLLKILDAARRRVAPDTGSAEVRLRERLDRTRAAVEQLRADNARLSEQLRALRAASRDAGVLRHQVPTPEPLAHLFAARAAARRSAGSGEASARETAFAAVAPAYRQAAADGIAALEGRADRIDAGGVAWWVPRDRRTRDLRPDEWLRLRPILQSRQVSGGGIAIDVGAHAGRGAVARAVLGDAVAVYAAEPDPLNYACLVQTVCANGLRGLVLPDRVAIGSSAGAATLLRSSFSGGHRIARGGAIPPGADVVDVPLVTLDAWIERLRIDPGAISFVQVDAQGSERDVLAGAGSLLACRHVAWQLRIAPDLLAAAGCGLQELFEAMAAAFTHFIDLHKRASGPRVRPVADLAAALEYLWTDDADTDLLLYSAA